jgi:hypothetical protein
MTPKRCAPRSSSAPATTPAWPAAATSPTGPANRLVSDALEADWNTALRAHSQAQDAYGQTRKNNTGQLTDAQKSRIRQLVTDLPAIWNDPATPARERKRIARLLLTDVTVTRNRDTITAHVRLPAGQHHTLTTPVPAHRLATPQNPADAVTVIDELLDHHPTPRSSASSTHARIASAWERRNSDQAGPVRRGAESIPAFFEISRTVDAETRTPRPASSSWVPAVAPFGVLTGQPEYQGLNVPAGRRPARSCRAWTWRPGGCGRCCGASARWYPG